MTGDSDLDKLPRSIKILVLDWDETTLNQHMERAFSKGYGVNCLFSHEKKSDYDSRQPNALTEQDIETFLNRYVGYNEISCRQENELTDDDRKIIQNEAGIKNPEQLKSALQKALERGVIVGIASFTNYPNAVKYVVEKHLGLSKEQAESIKVVGGLPPSKIRMEHGKNLHILTHILECLEEYKEKHDGALPEKVEVMLVDDDQDNVKCIKSFSAQISQLLEFIKNDKEIQSLLKINSKTINTQFTAEDLKEEEEEKKFIELTGVQVPKDPITQIREEDKQRKHYDYLNKAKNWAGVEKDVHYEKLKGPTDNGVEQNRTVKFAQKVQVRNILPEEQEEEREEVNVQRKQRNNVYTSHTPVETSTKTDNGGDGRKNSGNQKPQPWKKCAVIIAPAVIGLLIGGLIFAALPLAESPLLIAAMAAVVIIVAAYALEELLFKSELKPSSVFKELGEKVKNLFTNGEKSSSCTIM